MSTILRLFMETEDSKDKCLTDLKNARKFLVDMVNQFPDRIDFKIDNNWCKSFDEFLNHYDNFTQLVDKCSQDEGGEITFNDISSFPVSDNDIETGQLDFKNSLSIDNPYHNQVDNIQIQMCIDLTVNVLEKEMPKTEYGIGGDMNDSDEDYSDSYREIGI